MFHFDAITVAFTSKDEFAPPLSVAVSLQSCQKHSVSKIRIRKHVDIIVSTPWRQLEFAWKTFRGSDFSTT